MTQAALQAVRRRAASHLLPNKSAMIHRVVRKYGHHVAPKFMLNEGMDAYEWQFIDYREFVLTDLAAMRVDDNRFVVPGREFGTDAFVAAGDHRDLFEAYVGQLGQRGVVNATADAFQRGLILFILDGEIGLGRSESGYATGLDTLRVRAGGRKPDEPHGLGDWAPGPTSMGTVVGTYGHSPYDLGRTFNPESSPGQSLNVGFGHGFERTYMGPETQMMGMGEPRKVVNWMLTPMHPIGRTPAPSPSVHDVGHMFSAESSRRVVLNDSLGYRVEHTYVEAETHSITPGEPWWAVDRMPVPIRTNPLARTSPTADDMSHIFGLERAQGRFSDIALPYGIETDNLGLGTQVVTTHEPLGGNEGAPYWAVVRHIIQTPSSLDPGVVSNRQDTTIGDIVQRTLLTELELEFSAEPFEDGMDHEAEQTLSNALRDMEAEQILPWLGDLCTDINKPNLSASILRCLGRLHRPGTEAWRVQLIGNALANGKVEIRDAAVQAVEQWDDANLAGVLESHRENLPWLQDYIRGVVQDLEG